MAKCGVTNIGGGGGIGSDEVSATKDNVLSGKTYVGADTSDEIGTGTMVNNGTTGNQSLNAGSSFLVKKGYHAQGFSVGANSLASQTPGNASAGYMLSGQTAWVNGNKITGTIPFQNAEVAGTDHIWATNYSNFGDGNYFLGIRNGYYINGVNWVRGYNANFVAANIKKGVNVAGVVGTFEGYVASPTDWYYYGSNPAGFYAQYSNIVLESNQIKVSLSSGGGASNTSFYATNAYNLTGYSYLGITVSTGGAREISIRLTVSGFTGTIGPFTGSTTIYIPLINANVTGVPTITVSHNGAGVTTTYITRMWLT